MKVWILCFLKEPQKLYSPSQPFFGCHATSVAGALRDIQKTAEKKTTKTETNKNWNKEIKTYVNSGLEVAHAHSGSRLVFLVEIEIWKCWLLRKARKTEYPAKIFSEHRKEPTTNSTHIWRRRRDLNSGHIGERRVLSHCATLTLTPLLPPCTRGRVTWDIPVLHLDQQDPFSIICYFPKFLAVCLEKSLWCSSIRVLDPWWL